MSEAAIRASKEWLLRYLGSDIDDIPQASQKPGVACHAPMIEGAPGHGEGHNSGVPLNITAALAVTSAVAQSDRHEFFFDAAAGYVTASTDLTAWTEGRPRTFTSTWWRSTSRRRTRPQVFM